ncbi:uncharacterized protein LOC121411390 isoform X2 [Lytechinus variegatus]|uniref:uncharacterized protein LOC121411390 isoform X2 n=1 Tax=Lytechinus variegatus TaxID=7654 RepID=UPI001BB0F67B|nr:uncharacterized protein LOC121411390 isoform X2 [Lytechinus variegatus]
MNSKSFLPYGCRLVSAWLVTVASISMSITYLNSIPSYQHKSRDRKFVEKAEKISVYSRKEYVPCPAQGECDTSLLPARGEFQNGEFDIEKGIPPMKELYERFKVVTAVSQNHFEEVKPWIASIQRFMPGQEIILYNLGLNTTSLETVKNLCDVQVRTFPFKSYPKHVKNLHTYAWKPIIIDITLREFGAIFWGDSSIRLKGSLRKLLPVSLNHHGYMTHFHAFDPKKKEEIKHQYFYTHPQLYDNLGVNRTEYYHSDGMAPHAAANRQLYVNSSYIQQAIVQPMLKCALEYRCISPVGARLPKHRFDASILAILIYKNLKGEWKRTNNDNRYFDEVVYLRKNTLGKEKVKTCLW